VCDSTEAAATACFVFRSGTAVLLVDLTSETLGVVLFDVTGATPLLIEAARELNAATSFDGLAAVPTDRRFLVFADSAVALAPSARGALAALRDELRLPPLP
jgi:hypothetical protein